MNNSFFIPLQKLALICSKNCWLHNMNIQVRFKFKKFKTIKCDEMFILHHIDKNMNNNNFNNLSQTAAVTQSTLAPVTYNNSDQQPMPNNNGVFISSNNN